MKLAHRFVNFFRVCSSINDPDTLYSTYEDKIADVTIVNLVLNEHNHRTHFVTMIDKSTVVLSERLDPMALDIEKEEDFRTLLELMHHAIDLPPDAREKIDAFHEKHGRTVQLHVGAPS